MGRRAESVAQLYQKHPRRHMQYDCPVGLERDSLVARTVIRAMVPRPDVSLVTTFLFGSTVNDRTFLFPPILRRGALECTPTRGDHVLVYLTSGYESLLEQLTAFERERFLVYGYDRTDRQGPCQSRVFSREGFLRDLASAKGVIATAGVTLISESLYLRKPYCAFPMSGEFEQQLNAAMLEQLGFGKNARRLTTETVADFLYRLPDYERRLRDYLPSDNSKILHKLDELVADDASGAHRYHEMRK